MASIFSNAIEDFAPTKLFLRAKDNTPGAAILSRRKGELMDIFSKKGDISGVSATNKEEPFEFELGIKGGNPIVNIDIRDFPGEYLQNRADVVRQFMSESEIILLAIDSVYLMENGGEMNEEVNKVEMVTRFLTEYGDKTRNKMVLLVPLKCEKYYIEGRIENVTRNIQEKYSKLIDAMGNNNNACVITPIETLGNVVFDYFEDNNRGNEPSKTARYCYYGDNPKYAPAFCIQPLYYLLTYVADYNEWIRNQPAEKIWERLKRRLLNFIFSNKEFNLEVSALKRYRLTNGNGYKVVSTNSIWNGN